MTAAEKIKEMGIVPVVVLEDEKDAGALAKALCEGGLPCAEVTFRTAAAKESIRIMLEEYPEMFVGAGTVLTTRQVDEAIEAGARFIVSPGFDPEIVDYCIEKQIPVFPGCVTASELAQAVKRGLEVVKFFPAETSGGLAAIKALAAPYVGMKFMPTGGINLKNVRSYLESDVMTGLAYLLSVAAQERKPIILCLGMGSSMGNHNGSTALGVYLNRYLSVGSVAIVTCVGNEGNTRHHHTIRRKEDTIDISVSANMNGFMGQLWWQTPGSLSVDVISPSGETIREIRAVSGIRYEHRFVPENTTVEIYFGVAQELTREQVVVFRFQNPTTGIWKVRTQFDYEVPNFSMWLPIQQFLEKEVVFLDPDPDMTATNPSTTPFVTGVSAYDVRDGALYLQSGRGFTPFGYIKPEVVAPGVELTGTYPGNRYGTMTGTSVAAAFVAGISALFMQEYADDGANSNTVREALIRGAVPRGEPYPNTEWGYGIVDAYRSITDY